MHDLSGMIWIELKKAIRSHMPFWTALGSLFLPFGIAFLIFVSKNPDISRKLGLVSAKADLVAFSATDWQTYLVLYSQLIAAGGFFLFILVVSWIFGREFTDGTIKDLLAIPVERSCIVLAKFVLATIWAAGLTAVILMTGMLMGAAVQIPGAASGVLLTGCLQVLITGCLTIAVILPFAFLASIGRGYLLPLGLAVLTMMATNMVAILGWAEYFPWAVPGLFAQAKNPLGPTSYVILFLTALVGIIATILWWQFAEQKR